MSTPASPEEMVRSGEVAITKFNFYTARDFKDLPELDWRIEEILPTSGLASIYGPSGSGKTFLSLDMAAAVAEGKTWFGHPTKRCEVVYMALEGQAGIRLRVAAWEKHYQVKFPLSVSFIFDDFVLNGLEHPFLLAMQILQYSGAKD